MQPLPALGPAAAAAVIVLLFVLAACTTPMLRDLVPSQPDPGRRTFSLARFQLAWWSCLVLAGYAYLCVSTHHYNSLLNDTCLVLLGISAGTTVTSVVIDDPPAPADAAPPPPSQGFVRDMISDTTGVNVHRLQMLLWTLIMGAVFIAEVVLHRAFPRFDGAHYALAGISSGAYLALKTKEA